MLLLQLCVCHRNQKLDANYRNKRDRQQAAALPVALVVFLVLSIVWTSVSCATELSIPGIKTQAGKLIEVAVNIDQVDNLAGIKLVMKYDPEILLYKSGKKTEHTASLMHIVNNKKPGLLIAVMAGAKGIKGKDFPILLLVFEVKKGLKGNLTTKLDITELQLMTDKLKDIKATIKVGLITILSQ